MNRIVLALTVLLVALGAGCGASPEHAAQSPAMAPEPPGGLAFGGPARMDVDGARTLEDSGEKLASTETVAAPSGGEPAQPSSTGGSVVPPAATPRLAAPLLIYSAVLHLAVFETRKAIDSAQALAVELGGYLVRRDDQTITVRVPAETYKTALGKVAELGDVLHREETVEDVTEQFFDLRTRLENARAMRTRLEKLLEQAQNVKDALEVERELGRVTEEIDRIEGKLKRLSELIAFSTITLQFQPLSVGRVDSKVKLPFPWLDRLGLPHLLGL